MLKRICFCFGDETDCDLHKGLRTLMEELAAQGLMVEKLTAEELAAQGLDVEGLTVESLKLTEEKAGCAEEDAEESAVRKLTEQGMNVAEGKAASSAGDAKTGQENEVCLKGLAEALYVTDRAEVYAALRAKGRYVLPCYHKSNRDASFPGALYVMEKLEEADYDSFELVYRRLAGQPWDILTTKRCIVRETTVEDVDSFYRIYAEPSVSEYTENLFADRDEEIAYTKEYREKVYAFYGYGMWTVLERESGEVIGRAGVSWREGYDLPELGFVFGVPWHGKGYAFEVCSAILTYAAEELLMERVQALVQPGNERSLKLCERLGFVRCGETVLDGVRHFLLVKEL